MAKRFHHAGKGRASCSDLDPLLTSAREMNDSKGHRASPPLKARDAFRPQRVSVSSHLGVNSFNPKHSSSAHHAMGAGLIVSVDQSVEILDVGWLTLLLAQPKPCSLKADLFLEARSQAVNIRLLRLWNVSI
jgi:hypothetical protein